MSFTVCPARLVDWVQLLPPSEEKKTPEEMPKPWSVAAPGLFEELTNPPGTVPATKTKGLAGSTMIFEKLKPRKDRAPRFAVVTGWPQLLPPSVDFKRPTP